MTFILTKIWLKSHMQINSTYVGNKNGKDDASSNVLKVTLLQVFENQDCVEAYYKSQVNYDDEVHICAAHKNQTTGMCSGDSGGEFKQDRLTTCFKICGTSSCFFQKGFKNGSFSKSCKINCYSFMKLITSLLRFKIMDVFTLSVKS